MFALLLRGCEEKYKKRAEHRVDFDMNNTGSFDYSDIKDQAILPYVRWLSSLTEEQKKAFVTTPTIVSDGAGAKLMAVLWTTSARFACNRNKDRVDNVWEQYVNPDNQPIILDFRPKEGAVVGAEFVSDGPAERFTQRFTYRSIGTVSIEGKEQAAFVSTVIRKEIGNPDNETKGRELIVDAGSGKMLSMFFCSDGRSSDLPTEFMEIRVLEPAWVAIEKVLFSVQKALRCDFGLSMPRRGHLAGIEITYKDALVKYRPK